MYMATPDVVGYWSSIDLYQGSPEEDALAFVADGSAWYDWSSMGGGFEVLRFRWEISEPNELIMHMTLYLHGTWSRGSEPGNPAYHVVTRQPMDEVRRTKYTIEPALNALRLPVTVLSLASNVLTGHRFAFVRSKVDIEDDPTYGEDGTGAKPQRP
jgi:hypothetical protein